MHSPVSDSIDLNDLHFPAAKRRSGEWIEALQTSQSPSKHVVASPGEAFRPYTTPKSRVYETTVDESPIPITQDPTSFCKSSSSLQIAGDSPLLSSNANRSPYTESNTNSPLPRQDSAYSSTLMQALSMSEGAVVTTQVKSRKSRAQSVPSRTTSELYEDGMRAKLAKQQWVSLEQKRQQQLEEAKIKRDCSFSPSISRYAKNIRRPSSLHPQNRASAEVLRKRQWQALKAREQAERELEECTFRPLTLSTARLEQGAITAGPGVHNELYYEAQQRRHFNEVVKPRLVEEVDEAVRTKGGSNRVSPEGLEQIVSRLFSKVVSDKQAPPVVHSFQPQITEASKKIVREKVLLGERDPNIVEHLYTENDQKKPLDGQEDVEGCILESKRKIMKEVFKLKMEEDRDKLDWEYKTGLLVEKYRALSKRASVANGRVYYPDQPQSVLGLARAALDVLTPAEAEELLNVLDGYKQPHTVVGSFVNCVVDYVKEQTEADPEYCSPLLTVLPNSRKPRHVAPPKGKELPIVKREAADPELLQRAREKREEELRQYKASREAAEQEEYPFRPAPPQPIPYVCRPDVNVAVKTTKSEQLRRVSAVMKMQGVPPPTTETYAQKDSLSSSRSLFGKPTTTTTTTASSERYVNPSVEDSPPPKPVMERFTRMDAADVVATSVSPSLSLPSRKTKDGSSTASKRSSSARETELAVQQVRHQIASNAKNQKNDLVRIGQDLLLQQLRQQRKGI